MFCIKLSRYSLNGEFTVTTTILGTGVNGNATGGTVGTFQLALGWGQTASGMEGWSRNWQPRLHKSRRMET